jgi:hypothetical protein
MGRTVRTVTTLLFVGVVVAIGLAVLYFGTSTGLINGGGATSIGGATRALPYYAQVGWLRNTAPWPITIESITTNVAHEASAPVVYIEHGHSDVATKPGTAPIWTKASPNPPYQMVGNSLRYLGFAVAPAPGHIASFTSITVYYKGPLGFSFHKTFPGTIVAASSPSLPSSLLAADPATDTTSLPTYLAIVRAALEKKNAAALAVVMGGDATPTDATALLAKEKGLSSHFTQVVVPTVNNPDIATVTYQHASTKLAPITVVWAGFRWSVTR